LPQQLRHCARSIIEKNLQGAFYRGSKIDTGLGRSRPPQKSAKNVTSKGESIGPRFAALTDRLAPKLKKLLEALRYGELPLDMPEKGIYLYSRGKKHLYIGRSNGCENGTTGISNRNTVRRLPFCWPAKQPDAYARLPKGG